MIFHFEKLLPALGALLLWSCSQNSEIKDPAQMIDIKGFEDHIRVLSSDEFEGRSPSSPGEQKTLEYLEKSFQQAGAEPGNGSSFLQAVPLVSMVRNERIELILRRGEQEEVLEYSKDMNIWTKRVQPQVELSESEVVFVGYGIVAPEYNWNDYEGLDVTGKTVVILVNDPGYRLRKEDLFEGKSMTYYGRWTYKYEEAARQGAAAALVVHQTGPAGYPWPVVSGENRQRFDLESPDGNASRCVVEGWITESSAKLMFEMAGLDMDQMIESAGTSEFDPQELGIQISTTITNEIEKSTSNNVIAKITGSERPDEYIIYSAHWDHLGINPSLEGDQIFNGARDNATGTAALLELAQAFKSGPPPSRSVLFLAVTAEERGLLGSQFYAENPIYPLAQTVANINMDALDIWGKMNDVIVIGYGNSQLDDYLARAAKTQQRTLRPDPESEKGYYFRSDHLNFAKRGVPALYAKGGLDHPEYGEEWTLKQKAQHTAERYHKVGDELDDTWDLKGTVLDLQLLYRVGADLANSPEWPEWNAGVSFKAIREEQRKAVQ